jgi:hypothetical protein
MTDSDSSFEALQIYRETFQLSQTVFSQSRFKHFQGQGHNVF